MNKKILTYLTAISVAVTTIRYPTPAKSNPAAIMAPAICSTGVGCLFLGIVAVGGISYYLWQHNSSGQQFYVPIVDDENPGGWEPSDTAVSITIKGCHEIARRYGKVLVDYELKRDATGGEYYVCKFQ